MSSVGRSIVPPPSVTPLLAQTILVSEPLRDAILNTTFDAEQRSSLGDLHTSVVRGADVELRFSAQQANLEPCDLLVPPSRANVDERTLQAEALQNCRRISDRTGFDGGSVYTTYRIRPHDISTQGDLDQEVDRQLESIGPQLLAQIPEAAWVVCWH
jgi:hypothetical protein